jgi:hypothetical protein
MAVPPGGDGTGEDQRLQPRARQFRRSTASTRSSRGDPSSPPTVTSSLDRCPDRYSKTCLVPKKSLWMTDTVAPEPTPEQAALFA